MAPIATFLLTRNAQLAHNECIHRQSQLLPDFVHYRGCCLAVTQGSLHRFAFVACRFQAGSDRLAHDQQKSSRASPIFWNANQMPRVHYPRLHRSMSGLVRNLAVITSDGEFTIYLPVTLVSVVQRRP